MAGIFAGALLPLANDAHVHQRRLERKVGESVNAVSFEPRLEEQRPRRQGERDVDIDRRRGRRREHIAGRLRPPPQQQHVADRLHRVVQAQEIRHSGPSASAG